MMATTLVLPANVDTITTLERLKLKYRCYYCDELERLKFTSKYNCDEVLWAFVSAEQNDLIIPLERVELCYHGVTYILEALHDKFIICSAYDKGNSDVRTVFFKYYHEVYRKFADMLKNKNSANNS